MGISSEPRTCQSCGAKWTGRAVGCPSCGASDSIVEDTNETDAKEMAAQRLKDRVVTDNPMVTGDTFPDQNSPFNPLLMLTFSGVLSRSQYAITIISSIAVTFVLIQLWARFSIPGIFVILPIWVIISAAFRRARDAQSSLKLLWWLLLGVVLGLLIIIVYGFFPTSRRYQDQVTPQPAQPEDKSGKSEEDDGKIK